MAPHGLVSMCVELVLGRIGILDSLSIGVQWELSPLSCLHKGRVSHVQHTFYMHCNS